MELLIIPQQTGFKVLIESRALGSLKEITEVKFVLSYRLSGLKTFPVCYQLKDLDGEN